MKAPKQYRTVSQGAVQAFVVLFLMAWLVAGAGFFFSVRALQGEIAGRATVTQLCVTGNEFRGQQVQLWGHIIAISAPPPKETPAQHRARAALTAAFQAYVRKVFAARDCGNPPGG